MKKSLFVFSIVFATLSTVKAQINWQHTNGPEGGSALDIYYNSQYAFYPDDRVWYRSTDGLQWEELPYNNLWPVAITDSMLVAVQGYNLYMPPIRFLVSHDQGTTWREGVLPPGIGFFSEMEIAQDGIYILEEVANRLHRSTDEGLTWDTIAVPGVYLSGLHSCEGRICVNNSKQMWRLRPDGISWELISPAFASGEYVKEVSISGSRRLIGTSNGAWYSENNGVTWKKTTLDRGIYNRFVQVGHRIYTIKGNIILIFSDDNGKTWQEYAVDPYYQPSYNEIGTLGGRLLASTYNKGLLYLDETDKAFKEANTGIKSASVYDLDVSDSLLWAACPNGVFAYDLHGNSWLNKAKLPLLPRAEAYQQVAVSASGYVAVLKSGNYHFYLSVNNGMSWDTIQPNKGSPNTIFSVSSIKWIDDILWVQDDFGGYYFSSNDLGQTWNLPTTYFEDIVKFKGNLYGISSNQPLFVSQNQGQIWNETPFPVRASNNFLNVTADRLFLFQENLLNNTQLWSSADGLNWQYSGDGLPDMSDRFRSFFDKNPNDIWQHGGRYYINSPVGLFVSLDTCKTWLAIQRSSGAMALYDTTFFAGGSGVWKSGLPPHYGALTSGIVFKDDNNNGLQDNGEVPLPDVRVSIYQPRHWFPYWFTNTRTDGAFVLNTIPGSSDTLRPDRIPSKYLQNINPPWVIVNGHATQQNFGVRFSQQVADAKINGGLRGRPRPGFSVPFSIQFENVGTLPLSGKISVKLTPGFKYTLAHPPPTAIIGNDSLEWHFQNLTLFKTDHIYVEGTLDVSVPLGALFTGRGYIRTDQPDTDITDNFFIFQDTVVSSFDPNEKKVEPARGLTAAEISAGRALQYTIHFQNTGTFQAERVRITDMLDTALDVRSLRVVATSHPLTGYRLLPGNLLEFTFDDIALPDSNTNEPASHGFVTFSVKRKRQYNPFFKIRNRAAIYFDFNEPIITNTVETRLLTPTVSTSDPGKKIGRNTVLSVWPNPFPNTTAIGFYLPRADRMVLCITDISGKQMYHTEGFFQEGNHTLEINAATKWPSGVYFCQVSTAQGNTIAKMIKQ